jgi:hypothetical protein
VWQGRAGTAWDDESRQGKTARQARPFGRHVVLKARQGVTRQARPHCQGEVCRIMAWLGRHVFARPGCARLILAWQARPGEEVLGGLSGQASPGEVPLGLAGQAWIGRVARGFLGWFRFGRHVFARRGKVHMAGPSSAGWSWYCWSWSTSQGPLWPGRQGSRGCTRHGWLGLMAGGATLGLLGVVPFVAARQAWLHMDAVVRWAR